MTPELSEYATSVPCGCEACVWRIILKSESSSAVPSSVQDALKILWRQCSEFTWPNITISVSVGFLPALAQQSAR